MNNEPTTPRCVEERKGMSEQPQECRNCQHFKKPKGHIIGECQHPLQMGLPRFKDETCDDRFEAKA